MKNSVIILSVNRMRAGLNALHTHKVTENRNINIYLRCPMYMYVCVCVCVFGVVFMFFFFLFQLLYYDNHISISLHIKRCVRFYPRPQGTWRQLREISLYTVFAHIFFSLTKNKQVNDVEKNEHGINRCLKRAIPTYTTLYKPSQSEQNASKLIPNIML